MRGGERFLCNKCMLCTEETPGTRWSRYKILRPMSLMEVESCLGVDSGLNVFTAGRRTSWAVCNVLSGYTQTEGLSLLI